MAQSNSFLFVINSSIFTYSVNFELDLRIGSEKTWDRGAALTSRLQTFETEMLAEEENFLSLARINRELIGKAEAFDVQRRIVLGMDSTGIQVYGRQEQSAYNCHFEST